MKSAITMIIEKIIFNFSRKVLTPAFALLTSFTSHAQAYPVADPDATYKQISSRAFENMEIKGDVTVILTNEQTTSIMVRGNEKDINLVKTTGQEKKLEINAEKIKSASKVIVYVPATALHSLEVTGNARILSSGNIPVDDLEIILNGASMVKVYCYGKLKVTPAEGYELRD